MTLRYLAYTAILAGLFFQNASPLWAQGSDSRRIDPNNEFSSMAAGSFSKMAVETPLKKLISSGSSPVSLMAPARLNEARTSLGRFPLTSRSSASASPSATPLPADSSKVQAGLVSWHPDIQTACLYAKRSGKPVLHFQMMGRLDEEFC